MKDEIFEQYAEAMEPLIPLAKRAFGSRDIVSPQHDASREYTRLLKEFYNGGGSLLKMADRLGVNYAGLNRRVKTADLKPSSGRARKKFTNEEYAEEVYRVLSAKEDGVEEYHKALLGTYDKGMSLARIAKDMGLSSANPLWYGVNKLRMARGETDVEK